MKRLIPSAIIVTILSMLTFFILRDNSVDLDYLVEVDLEILPNEYNALKKLEPYQYYIDQKMLSQVLKSKGVEIPQDGLMMIAFKGNGVKLASFISWNDHSRWLDFERLEGDSSQSTLHVYSMPAKYRNNLVP